MSDETERLRRTVNDLHHSLMRHVQKHPNPATMCAHVTLRPPYLPCPHPDCYTSTAGIFLNVERIQSAPLFYSADVTPDYTPPSNRETWMVDSARLGEEVVWCWRRTR